MTNVIFMLFVVREIRKNKLDGVFWSALAISPKMQTCLGTGNCRKKNFFFSFHLPTKREKEAKRENLPTMDYAQNWQAKLPANRYILVKGKVFSYYFLMDLSPSC